VACNFSLQPLFHFTPFQLRGSIHAETWFQNVVLKSLNTNGGSDLMLLQPCLQYKCMQTRVQ